MKTKRIFSMVLILCMVLTLLPMEAFAADPGSSASVRDQINAWAGGTIKATKPTFSNVITVTGTWTNANRSLSIRPNDNVRIIWDAHVEGSGNQNYLIKIGHGGELQVYGKIIATNNPVALWVDGYSYKQYVRCYLESGSVVKATYKGTVSGNAGTMFTGAVLVDAGSHLGMEHGALVEAHGDYVMGVNLRGQKSDTSLVNPVFFSMTGGEIYAHDCVALNMGHNEQTTIYGGKIASGCSGSPAIFNPNPITILNIHGGMIWNSTTAVPAIMTLTKGVSPNNIMNIQGGTFFSPGASQTDVIDRTPNTGGYTLNTDKVTIIGWNRNSPFQKTDYVNGEGSRLNKYAGYSTGIWWSRSHNNSVHYWDRVTGQWEQIPLGIMKYYRDNVNLVNDLGITSLPNFTTVDPGDTAEFKIDTYDGTNPKRFLWEIQKSGETAWTTLAMGQGAVNSDTIKISKVPYEYNNATVRVTVHDADRLELNQAGRVSTGTLRVNLPTVVYHANGGSGTVPATTTHYAGVIATAAQNTGGLTKGTEVFMGWNTEPDGSGTFLRPGTQFIISLKTNLYAQYQGNLTVTYDKGDADGGTPPTDSSVYDGNAEVTVKDGGSLTKAGYEFKSWNTNKDLTGASYAPLDTFNIGGHTTLYPEWQSLRPIITEHPKTGKVTVGTAYFNVKAIEGKQPYTYRWQYYHGTGFEGEWRDIESNPSARTATLSIPISGTDLEAFRCVVTGTNGLSAESNPATLVKSESDLIWDSGPRSPQLTGVTNPRIVVVNGAQGDFWPTADVDLVNKVPATLGGDVEANIQTLFYDPLFVECSAALIVPVGRSITVQGNPNGGRDGGLYIIDKGTIMSEKNLWDATTIPLCIGKEGNVHVLSGGLIYGKDTDLVVHNTGYLRVAGGKIHGSGQFITPVVQNWSGDALIEVTDGEIAALDGSGTVIANRGRVSVGGKGVVGQRLSSAAAMIRPAIRNIKDDADDLGITEIGFTGYPGGMVFSSHGTQESHIVEGGKLEWGSNRGVLAAWIYVVGSNVYPEGSTQHLTSFTSDGNPLYEAQWGRQNGQSGIKFWPDTAGAFWPYDLATVTAANPVLTYHGNGAESGTVPTDVTYTGGDTVTVAANTGGLTKTGFIFNGWNTASDGSGTAYKPDDTFKILENTTLYAGWVSAAPKITRQPALVTTVSVGEMAVFDIEAAYGTPPLNYQWQVSTNGGTAWSSVTNGNGGNTPIYATVPATAGMNNYLYRCVVTDDDGNGTEVTSSSAKLVVTEQADTVVIGIPDVTDTVPLITSAIQAAINTGGGTITVEGSYTPTTDSPTLVLNLNNKTVEWKAGYSGRNWVADYSVINLTGPGAFNISDCEISSRGKSTIINNNGAELTVKDGARLIHTGQNSRAILNNAGGTVNVTGGIIQMDYPGTASYLWGGNTAIENKGTANISGGQIHAYDDGSDTVVNYGTLNISDGVVFSDLGRGIYADFSTSKINITGGAVYNFAKGQPAVYFHANSEFTATGGLVFSFGDYGSSGGGVGLFRYVIYPGYAVTSTLSEAVTPGGNAIFGMWAHTQSGSALYNYSEGSADNIEVRPSAGASAEWTTGENGGPAIRFTRNTNTKLIELPESAKVTITTSKLAKLLAAIRGYKEKISAPGFTATVTELGNDEYEVTVTEYNTNTNSTNPLVLDIPDGVKVIWDADLKNAAKPALEITGDGSFVMEGGTVETNKATAMLVQAGTEVVINDGTVKSDKAPIRGDGAIINRGNVTVNGGTISTESGDVVFTYAGAGLTVTGGVIRSKNGTAVKGEGKVNISGGKFTAQGNHSALCNESNGIVTITGGEFTSAQTTIYNSDGGKIEIGGTASVKTTSTNTSHAAVHNNRTGHIEISSGEFTSTQRTIINQAGGTVTISGGTLKSTSTDTSHGVVFNNGTGTITIDGGEFESKKGNGIINHGNGQTVINGGNVKLGGGFLSAIVNNNAGTITITGGEFVDVGDYGAAVVNQQFGGGVINIEGGLFKGKDGQSAVINSHPGEINITGGVIIGEIGAVRNTSSTIDFTGGAAFSTGTTENNVLSGSGGYNRTGDAVAIAWNTATPGPYNAGSNTGLNVFPNDATAVWGRSGGQLGILYENGSNKGFIPVDGVNIQNIPTLSGTVTISGMNPRIGDELKGTFTGTSTGKLTYQWKVDGANVNTEPEDTYTVKLEDLGKVITIEVTSDAEMGTLTCDTAPVLKKAGPDAPDAPKLAGRTNNSVSLMPVDDMEYSLGGTAWQPGSVFDGLNPGEQYTFYQRFAETADTEASLPSEGLAVTTGGLSGAPLTGDAVINNPYPRIGSMLTGTLINGNDTGTLTYKWIIDNVEVGAERMYRVQAADLDKAITLEIESAEQTGKVTSAPTAPVMKSDDDISVSLNTVEIIIGTNRWQVFLNTVTFGLFFKDTQSVEIKWHEYADVEKAEYFTSETAYTYPAQIPAETAWTAYTGPFNIDPGAKLFIYAKLTNSENEVEYLRSDGVVLYTNPAQDTASISFTNGSGEDKTANVTLNGNTVKSVVNGASTLILDTHYTVAGGTITFKAGYLENLAPDNYTLTVSYNPQGVEQSQASVTLPDITTTIALTVSSPVVVPTYNLTVTAGANGTVSGTATGSYAAGHSVSVTAIPDSGYKFSGWTASGVTLPSSTANPAEFSMPAGTVTLTANFTVNTAPTGKISIGTHQWNAFWNAVTFGLLAKNTQTVTITATDNSGGAATVEYYLSQAEMTEGQLDALTGSDWTAGSSFNINPKSKHIIYVRLTDTSGNIAYINSAKVVVCDCGDTVSGNDCGCICDPGSKCGCECVVCDTGTVFNAPVITTATLAEGTYGSPYSVTLTATGDAPIAWSIESGSLPTGLSLSSNGMITGTPTAEGTFTFTVKAANKGGLATKELSIKINADNSHVCSPSNQAAVDADCTVALVCSCGQTIKAGRSSHTWGAYLGNTATCTATGTETAACNHCSATNTRPTGKKQHTPGVAATCEAPQICTVCNTELNPALTHTWGEWKSDSTNHWKECGCGKKDSLAPHTTGDWNIDKHATATQNGERHKKCTVCGYIMETEVIPATGSQANPPTTPTNPPANQTGSSANQPNPLTDQKTNQIGSSANPASNQTDMSANSTGNQTDSSTDPTGNQTDPLADPTGNQTDPPTESTNQTDLPADPIAESESNSVMAKPGTGEENITPFQKVIIAIIIGVVGAAALRYYLVIRKRRKANSIKDSNSNTM